MTEPTSGPTSEPSSADPAGHRDAARSRVIVKTRSELLDELAGLEADKATWLRLQDRYGSLEWGLDSEIDSVRWLLGEDAPAPQS